MAVVVYFALSFVIALMGSKRKFGFWGYFFCSLALTPFVGTIVLLGSDAKKKDKAAS